jgi:hypothetical protein
MTSPIANPVLVDIKTAAELLALSVDTLRREMYAGRIVPKVYGTKALFQPDELTRYADALPSWEPK